jgi:hypothetical protein
MAFMLFVLFTEGKDALPPGSDEDAVPAASEEDRMSSMDQEDGASMGHDDDLLGFDQNGSSAVSSAVSSTVVIAGAEAVVGLQRGCGKAEPHCQSGDQQRLSVQFSHQITSCREISYSGCERMAQLVGTVLARALVRPAAGSQRDSKLVCPYGTRLPPA